MPVLVCSHFTLREQRFLGNAWGQDASGGRAELSFPSFGVSRSVSSKVETRFKIWSPSRTGSWEPLTSRASPCLWAKGLGELTLKVQAGPNSCRSVPRVLGRQRPQSNTRKMEWETPSCRMRKVPEAVDSVSTVNCWCQATSGNGKREIGGISSRQSHADEILEPKKKRGCMAKRAGYLVIGQG